MSRRLRPLASSLAAATTTATRAARASLLGGLRLAFLSRAELTPAQVAECHALRARLIGLRPETDPAEDRAFFEAVLGRAWRVATLRDPEGRLVGFSDLQVHRRPDALILQGEYGFLEPRWRGHAATQLMILRPLAEAWLRYGRGRTCWYVGDAYPTGLRPFARAVPEVWLAGEAEAPAAVRAFMAAEAETLYGARWEADRQRIRLPTRPGPFEIRGPWEAALLARYERVNPEWREGFAALMVFPVTGATLVRVVGAAWNRRRRSR